MAFYRRNRMRRFYGRMRYGSWRSRGRAAIGNKWVTFGAGAAAGFMAPKVIPMQDEIALVICAAPVKMPRAVRSVASGYVIGRILKNIVGGGMSGSSTGGSGWY